MNSNIKNLFQQGITFADEQAYEDAANCFKSIVQKDSSRIDALINLGLMYYYSGHYLRAEKIMLSAIEKLPKSPDIYFYMGLIYSALEKISDAVACYKKTVLYDPNYVPAWYNLGDLLFNQKQYTNAIEYFQKAISIDEKYTDAHLNLGESYSRIGQFKKAITCFERVISIQPNHTEAFYNMGVAYNKLNLYNKAIEAYDNALTIDSNHVKSHYNKSFILLLLGDFLNGFIEYEWRLKKQETYKSSSQKPFWQGKNASGQSLLVYAEQGFGDCIQFIRFLPMIQKRLKCLIFECQPELTRLFTDFPGIDILVQRGQSLPSHDLQISLLSLGHILNISSDSLPGKFPYLYPKLPLKSELSDKIQKTDQRLKVGIVWGGTGSTVMKTDMGRSLFLKECEVLLDMEDIQFFSFQKGPRLRELNDKPGEKLIDLGHYCSDFADTAIAAKHMDLIITVDTAMAHLAGALGLDVWTLLGFDADWRWLKNTNQSPWYPNMKLFRQDKPGNWKELINKVKHELIKQLETRKVQVKQVSKMPKLLKKKQISMKQHTEPAFKKATHYFQQNNLDKAKKIILSLIKKNPSNATYWHFLGMIAAKLKHNQIANNCLKKACSLSPELKKF
ncbi:TPR repeat-containing protein [Candidatus Magnetomorum sp. HK-1]|nr:TPR repeat-containing protein [Candidatus Magnetomorum sp. HK-1]